MATYKPQIEYTEKGWRRTTDTNRHHRENGWDYCGRAIYHFTFVVADRYPLFGQLEAPTPQEAQIVLNDYGQQVKNLLIHLPQFYHPKGYALKVLASQVMPDHIHLVLQVLEPLPKSIGTVVRGFKAACTKIYKEQFYPNGENAAEMHEESKARQDEQRAQNNQPHYQNKAQYQPHCPNALQNRPNNPNQACESIVHFARIFAGRWSVWQPEAAYYHERILHSDGQLRHMIDYVHDNPRRLALKRANPHLFRLHQCVQVAGFACTTLGNQFLLDFPMRGVIQCSRRLTQAEIDLKKEQCFEEAERGTVFVSGGISEGEKQICRALREAGFPLIMLLKDGFPKESDPHYRYFKPQGVYFEACAAGQLLLIEPSEELYTSKPIEQQVYAKAGALPHDTMRYRFLALNELARQIGN
jgi:REP element-mobilizing transposase RayT